MKAKRQNRSSFLGTIVDGFGGHVKRKTVTIASQLASVHDVWRHVELFCM